MTYGAVFNTSATKKSLCTDKKLSGERRTFMQTWPNTHFERHQVRICLSVAVSVPVGAEP